MWKDYKRYAPINPNIIPAIDVGTTKVCTIVARKVNGQKPEIIAYSNVPCSGLKKGNVEGVPRAAVDLQSTSASDWDKLRFTFALSNLQQQDDNGNIKGYNTKIIFINLPKFDIIFISLDKYQKDIKTIFSNADKLEIFNKKCILII